jgi:hypothetical protein
MAHKIPITDDLQNAYALQDGAMFPQIVAVSYSKKQSLLSNTGEVIFLPVFLYDSRISTKTPHRVFTFSTQLELMLGAI